LISLPDWNHTSTTYHWYRIQQQNPFWNRTEPTIDTRLEPYKYNLKLVPDPAAEPLLEPYRTYNWHRIQQNLLWNFNFETECLEIKKTKIGKST
jgi:hypothetical protein